MIRHGLDTNAPEYRSWTEMKRRCRSKHRAEYKNYGGRGIKVCDRWLNSYSAFLADMGKKPTPKHQIERIDNNGDYEPDNCRWATAKEQGMNRRTNHLVTIEGRTQTIQQWCDEYGIPDNTFHNRLRRGWVGMRLVQKQDGRLKLNRVGAGQTTG